MADSSYAPYTVTPELSVAIPTYQGLERLRHNLPAARAALERTGLSWEIVVSDDASHDGSPAVLEREFPWVRVLAGQDNLGFAGNVNRALRATTGRLVLALNDDVVLEPEYFVSQIARFKDPQLFAVMGAILDPDGRLIDAAKFPARPGPGWCRGLRTTLNFVGMTDSESRALPTLFASGANALMDRAKLEELGFFLELYSPYYMEDADLGVRAWRRGWTSLFDPSAKCRHEVSSTIRTFNRVNVRVISRRNRWLFNAIHLPVSGLVAWMSLQVLTAPLRLLKEPRVEWRLWIELAHKLSGAFALRRALVLPLSLPAVRRKILHQIGTEAGRFF